MHSVIDDWVFTIWESLNVTFGDENFFAGSCRLNWCWGCAPVEGWSCNSWGDGGGLSDGLSVSVDGDDLSVGLNLAYCNWGSVNCGDSAGHSDGLGVSTDIDSSGVFLNSDGFSASQGYNSAIWNSLVCVSLSFSCGLNGGLNSCGGGDSLSDSLAIDDSGDGLSTGDGNWNSWDNSLSAGLSLSDCYSTFNDGCGVGLSGNLGNWGASGDSLGLSNSSGLIGPWWGDGFGVGNNWDIWGNSDSAGNSGSLGNSTISEGLSLGNNLNSGSNGNSHSLSVGLRCWCPWRSWGNSDGVNLNCGSDSLSCGLSNDGNDSTDGGGLLVSNSLNWGGNSEGLGEVLNSWLISPWGCDGLAVGGNINGGGDGGSGC